MKRLLSKLRDVEAFLRGQHPNGELSESAADALARYYAYLGSFVDDPDTLFDIARWTAGLGHTYSPELSHTMRRVSQLIGWQNAVRLRSFYRHRPGHPRGAS
jgi:hypothetical protein